MKIKSENEIIHQIIMKMCVLRVIRKSSGENGTVMPGKYDLPRLLQLVESKRVQLNNASSPSELEIALRIELAKTTPNV